jgi:hypothetical protein
LPEATPENLKDELIDLGLFESVRDVLPKPWNEE